MKSPALVSVTRPMGELAHLTPEEYLAYIARVSSPQNQDNHDTALKLLRFCLVNGHWSVFDQVDLTIEYTTSRAIQAQVLRHWSFDFQEFSQRYATVTDVDFLHVETRAKAVGGNRQGSGGVDEAATQMARASCEESLRNYNILIDHGIAPETARMVLPMAVPTRAYIKGSVRSWITYFWQRLDGHAQKEHRELAEQFFNIFEELFPNLALLVKQGRGRYVTELEQDDRDVLIAIKKGEVKLVPAQRGPLAFEA